MSNAREVLSENTARANETIDASSAASIASAEEYVRLMFQNHSKFDANSDQNVSIAEIHYYGSFGNDEKLAQAARLTMKHLDNFLLPGTEKFSIEVRTDFSESNFRKLDVLAHGSSLIKEDFRDSAGALAICSGPAAVAAALGAWPAAGALLLAGAAVTAAVALPIEIPANRLARREWDAIQNWPEFKAHQRK